MLLLMSVSRFHKADLVYVVMKCGHASLNMHNTFVKIGALNDIHFR